MAGASIAAHLAEHASVHLLEMEPSRAITPRDARPPCSWSRYGNETVRALTRASRAFLYSPPPSFCSRPLVTPRALLLVARSAQAGALQAFLDSVRASDAIEVKSAHEALELHPLLRPDNLSEPHSPLVQAISMFTRSIKGTCDSCSRGTEASRQAHRSWRSIVPEVPGELRPRAKPSARGWWSMLPAPGPALSEGWSVHWTSA